MSSATFTEKKLNFRNCTKKIMFIHIYFFYKEKTCKIWVYKIANPNINQWNFGYGL